MRSVPKNRRIYLSRVMVFYDLGAGTKLARFVVLSRDVDIFKKELKSNGIWYGKVFIPPDAVKMLEVVKAF